MEVKAFVIDNNDLDEFIKQTMISRAKTIIEITIEVSEILDKIKNNNYSRDNYKMATHMMLGASFIHKDIIKELPKEYVDNYRDALSNINKHIMCMHTKMFEFIEENTKQEDNDDVDLNSLSKEELIAIIKDKKIKR